jgi:adenylate kinase family enzyme
MKMNYNIIHIVGASGAGTSALGQVLELKYGYKWLDTDGYFWQKTDPPFVKSLPHEERVKLMSAAIQEFPQCAISGSLCGWGDVFIPRFDLVVFIDTPTDVRIKRLEKREAERFGERIRKDGDMYENHIYFIEWAKGYDTRDDGRCRKVHEEWLKTVSCPILRLDGTTQIDELLEQVNSFSPVHIETDEQRRARIYPIILSEYNPAWPEWFAEERAILTRLIGAEKHLPYSPYRKHGSSRVDGKTYRGHHT